MNLQNMQYLLEISDSGSLSAAAKRLSVTQPYLSKVLRETEKEYGITIFTRGKTGIIPTESGRLFLDMSRDLLKHAEQFRQTFREHPDSCRLRIAADCCFPENDALSKTIHAFSDQHDRTFRLLYRELAGHEVIRELDAGHADIRNHKPKRYRSFWLFAVWKNRSCFTLPFSFSAGMPIRF